MEKEILVHFILTLFLFGFSTNSFSQTTTVLNPSSTTVQDAVIASIVPENNYGEIEDIHIYNWTQQGILNTVRPLIEFNLPDSLFQNIELLEAKLMIFHNPTSIYGEEHSGNNSFYIERIISEWDQESVIWDNQPETTPENRTEVSESISPNQNYEIDVTSLVNDMISNPDESFGFMLKHIDEQPYKVNFFASSDHPNSSLHPELIITYNIITSTSETSNEKDIIVFPNPTKSTVNIHFLGEIFIEKINVIDSSGRLINQFNSGVNEVRIPNKGFYMLEFFTENEKIIKKVIVN